MLNRFTRAYPEVQIELSITNRNVDLVAEGYDLAIRLGPLPDSGLVARKLEDAPLHLVAAPHYLERAGIPRHVNDLAKHQCLPFVMPSTGRCAPWLFRVEGRDIDWTPPGRIRLFDDVLGVVSLAESGLGIARPTILLCETVSDRGASSTCWSTHGAVPGLSRSSSRRTDGCPPQHGRSSISSPVMVKCLPPPHGSALKRRRHGPGHMRSEGGAIRLIRPGEVFQTPKKVSAPSIAC